MRLVYISSPLRGDMEKNMEKAKDYCAYAASCGVIPLAPHTIFTQYLNDAVPEQREQGLRMGHELLERCDELWVRGVASFHIMRNSYRVSSLHRL